MKIEGNQKELDAMAEFHKGNRAEGLRLQEEYGVRYLLSDFKKKGGYLESIRLSKEYDLYRQNFCGCVYSRQKMEDRES